MSNNESFIDEVSEEVRKDQLFGYLRRYGWIAVVLVLLLVGGTAYSEFQKSRTEAAAQAAGDAILAALELDDNAERAAALAALAPEGPARAVTGLLAASELQEAGDLAGAAASLDAVALDAEVPDVYRDLAALKSVMVQAGTLPADGRRARLSGLAEAGRPFRLIAKEQLAFILVETGETDAAIAEFAAIAQDAEVTQGLRDRAFRMIVALGGEIEDLFGAGDQATE